MMNNRTSCKNREYGKRCLLLGLSVILLYSILPGAEDPGQPLPDIVFVRIPSANEPSTAVVKTQYHRGRYVDGCQVVRLSFREGRAKEELLTAGFLSACDPEVSFDGTRILFAGKRQAGQPWQIWQMNLGDRSVKQVTRGISDAVSPLYVGSLFHLNDRLPTRKIVYRADGHLYTCSLDGSEPRQITFSPYPEFGPAVLPNGRIIFSRSGKTVDLLAVNIDGTDLLEYLTAADVPGNKAMVRVGSNGRVYFIRGDARQWLDGGVIYSVDMRRPLHSYQVVALAANGSFHTPCPLPDGRLIVSFLPKTKNSLFSLYLLPPIQKFCGVQGRFSKRAPGRRRQKLYTSDSHHCIDAHAIVSRPIVKGRSSFVAHEQDTGVLYCLDVYIGRRPEINRLARGTVKRVRVFTGQRQVLGTAPVEPDGSFHIRVPARTPLAFELLDGAGKTLLRQRTWTWVMPRESRGCIGCHEDRELAPPNKMAEALLKPAVLLIQKSGKQKGER
jgi:hypothetical protein